MAKSKKSDNKGLIIGGVILALGVGAYAYSQSSKKAAPTTTGPIKSPANPNGQVDLNKTIGLLGKAGDLLGITGGDNPSTDNGGGKAYGPENQPSNTDVSFNYDYSGADDTYSNATDDQMGIDMSDMVLGYL